MHLKNSQLRYLRGLCHVLKPVILMGAKGLTDAVVKELDRALADHELVKVKVQAEDREARKAIIEGLASASGAAIVQRIGNTVSLFRRNPDKPQIALPG